MAAGFVDGRTLVALVDNTAPWLALEYGRGPGLRRGDGIELSTDGGRETRGGRGYLDVIDRARTRDVPATEEALDSDDGLVGYFTLCLACHHATVATFVPTDVDTKIRGLLWRKAKSKRAVKRMFDATEEFCAWDVPPVSRRTVAVNDRLFSGHDGERLSVLVAALGQAIRVEAVDVAERALASVERELEAEAKAFVDLERAGGYAELDLLRLAAVMTHNAGDVDQGLSFWAKSEEHRVHGGRFGRLAHENATPFGGAFARAARVYKATLSPEGHRNYPLRAVRALRSSPDFMIEIAPFLDDWGERLGRDPRLSDHDRGELLEALVLGCRKLEGQRGYYRAIAGLREGMGAGPFDAIARRVPAAVRADLKSTEMRRALAVPRASFESSMRALLRRI